MLPNPRCFSDGSTPFRYTAPSPRIHSHNATRFSYSNHDNHYGANHWYASYSPAAESPQHPLPPRRQSTTRKERFSAATAADAERHGIAPGYSLKHWDPAERPIKLVGSVFDANSLGKWIFDWSVYCYGPDTPEICGSLWKSLILLAGRTKHAEAYVIRIWNSSNRAIVQYFIDSAEMIWDELERILKSGETVMLRTGREAGIAFVGRLFEDELQRERIKDLIRSIRRWSKTLYL